MYKTYADTEKIMLQCPLFFAFFEDIPLKNGENYRKLAVTGVLCLLINRKFIIFFAVTIDKKAFLG